MRKQRQQIAGGKYHIYSRGNEKKRIFLFPSDYEKFLKFLEEYSLKYNIDIFSYCLMSNHFHLLLKTNEANLSTFMERLLWRYVVWFNFKYDRVGHLFQSRFKSEEILDHRYFLEVSRYIHLNPCEAGIVKSPEKYEWSSYSIMLGQKENVFLNKSILENFGNIQAYNEFVLNRL